MNSDHDSTIVAPLDAVLLKGDADPTTRAIMSTALVLDRSPDFERLVEALERATRAVPRMRAQVVTSAWSMGQPHWVPDDHFSVRHHVREVGAPGDRSLRAVLAMASATATAPFDPARPLWDAVLVTGVEAGKAVLLLRAHHAIADGVRALHMMANLLDLEPDPSKPELPSLRQQGSSFGRASARRVRTMSDAMLTNQRRTRDVALATLRTGLRPLASLSSAATYARSALKTLGVGGAAPSPLLRARSRARTFGTLEFPLAEANLVTKANGATVNDFFLAGLLGGMRLYHEALGAQPSDIPVSFPVDLSGGESPETGNHFSAAVIPGPSSVADPTARLRLVHELVAARRVEPGLDAPVRVAPVLLGVPAWLASAGLTAYARRIDLQASNIMGPDCAVYLSGCKVDRFFAFGPLPGVPVMAVLVSYEGTCTVGFTIDPAAITDPGLFLKLVQESFDELLALA